MRYICFSILILMGSALQLFSQAQFFESGQTLRVDYFHTGLNGEETIVKDKLIRYNYSSFNPQSLIDEMNLGYYLMKVVDAHTNQTIFSRGFSSLYNEWMTTNAAKTGRSKVIHESFLLPFPKGKIFIQLWERDQQNEFTRFVGQLTVNPATDIIKKDMPPVGISVNHIGKLKNPLKSVDIAILGDGYRAGEEAKFNKDAQNYAEILLNTEPFKSYKNKINIHTVLNPSMESGTDEPDLDVWVRNSLNTSFNTFGSPRYLMTFDNEELRDVAGTVPYDFIIILVNTKRYGGGGIFRLYAVSTSDNKYSDYVFVHEFGHHFAGLGDEYYTSNVAYDDFYSKGVEPWEPNVTAFLDKTHVKWQQFLTPGIPLPTPWKKTSFDLASAEKKGNLDSLLKADPFYGKTGVFEGSGYASKGLYRPSVDCIMFSKGLDAGFDDVCKNAIIKMIKFYTR